MTGSEHSRRQRTNYANTKEIVTATTTATATAATAAATTTTTW